MVFGRFAAKNKKNLILELLAKNILNLMEIYFNGIGYWSGRIPRNFILRTNTFLERFSIIQIEKRNIIFGMKMVFSVEKKAIKFRIKIS